MNARVVAVSADRLNLVDDDGALIAVARKVASRDTWCVSVPSTVAVEFVEGELATRARLAEIGGAS
jgi:hypothetical protein